MENFLKIVILLSSSLSLGVCCPGVCACLPGPDGGFQALCVGAELTSVPEDFLPLTTHLYLSGNKISFINASDFLNLGNLVTLDLSSNIIEHIDKTAFHPLTKLTDLNLENNKITSLEAAHFQSLTELKRLYIGKNSNLVLNGPCTLSTLVNLRTLSLTNSPITYGLYLFGNSTSCSNYHCDALADNSMCHLPALEELDISYTATDTVPVELFGLMPNMKILSLAGNKLKEIPDGSFIDLVGLEELTLNYNNLTYVNQGTFNGTSNLTKLELGNEGLEVDPDVFDDMPNLSELSLTLLGQSVIDSLAPIVGNTGISKLNLHHNFLTSIPASMSHIPTLTSLDLSQNAITHIPGREFSTSLIELDLSNNNLSTLDEKAFWALTRISTLSLCKNRLETVPTSVFASLPSSAKICLGENPWICECEMKDIIADERHDTFPYPICSSPTQLQGTPFSVLLDSDICPVTTVTTANPTSKQTTVTGSTTTPTPTKKTPGSPEVTITDQSSPSTRIISTVPTTNNANSSPTPSGTAIPRPEHSTVRTVWPKTETSTVIVGIGESSSTVSTVTFVMVLILVPVVIALLVLFLCLYVKKMPRKQNQVNNATMAAVRWEAGSGHNAPLPVVPIESGHNKVHDPPPEYEEITNTYEEPTVTNNHTHWDNSKAQLLSDPAPVAISDPQKNPNVSAIFSGEASNSPPNQLPAPPPYFEVLEDNKSAAVYDNSIVNEGQTNLYDTKITCL